MRTAYLSLLALLAACAPATGKIETIEEIEQTDIENEDSQETDPAGTEDPDEQESEDQEKPDDEDWDEEKPDDEDWDEEKPDDEDWDEEKPDDEDWDPNDDIAEDGNESLAGQYQGEFELYTQNFQLLCDSTFDVVITDNTQPTPDTLYSFGDCQAPQGFTLSFELSGELDYYASEKANIEGDVTLFGPNGNSTTTTWTGLCYEYNGFAMGIEWEMEVQTPNGMRTQYGFLTIE